MKEQGHQKPQLIFMTIFHLYKDKNYNTDITIAFAQYIVKFIQTYQILLEKLNK